MATDATFRGASRRALARSSPDTLARLAFALMLIVAAVFLFRETRGSTFWIDEWNWILDRRGWDLDAFLKPHNEHLSVLPVAIYKLLFETVGLQHYAAFRALVITAHLGCTTLLYVYASRRVGSLVALCPAALLLFLGPGWQNIISPFQVTWLISLAAGIGALLALDRGDRRGDVIACGLVTVSLASSGLGLAIAIGVFVELAWARRPWRNFWIVAIPMLLYVVWSLIYQDAEVEQGNIDQVPHFAAESAAGAFSSLVGLAGSGVPTGVHPLEWGRPLGVAAAIGLGWALTRYKPIPPRILGLLAAALSFWVLTALGRALLLDPTSPRYLYAGALFVLLLAVELARGIRLTRTIGVVLAVLTAAVVLSNAGTLRDAGRFLRSQAELARADLAALEAARDVIGPRYAASSFPGTPYVILRAGPYFAAAKHFGSPAYSPSELASAPEPARLTADAELINAHRVGLRLGAPGVPSGKPPSVLPGAEGRVSERGACVVFQPGRVHANDATPRFGVRVPGSGMVVRTTRGTARVDVRRFAAGYSRAAPNIVAPSTSATLRIAPDRARQPWYARITAQERVNVCVLR